MKLKQHWQILIGIVSGLFVGLLLNNFSDLLPTNVFYGIKLGFQSIGEIFVRLLRMLVVPLVFASIYMAIVRLENISEIGKIGKKTIAFYLLTTTLAVLIGIVFVNIIEPGNVDHTLKETLRQAMNIPEKVKITKIGAEKNSVEIILDTIIGMIPTNPFEAFANTNILQVIFFAVFLAMVVISANQKELKITGIIDDLDKLMQKAVKFIIKLAPFFLFFLVGSIFMKVGFNAIEPLLKYAFTVVIGLLFHALVVLPLLVFLFTKKNPYTFLKKMTTPILTAWATSSSAATLPVTMQTMQEEVGVDPKVADFVLPLGATINMDGTALYESVAVIFIAGILGHDLSFAQQFIIFFTATLSAIGAASIPGAGLVTMAIVLTAVGLPIEAIGIVLAIDALLDQFRTAVNVWGDTTATYVIDQNNNKK